MGNTFDKIKKGFQETADKVTDSAEKVADPDTYTGSHEERRDKDHNQGGGKEPINPEDIAEHEPTAVKRDQGADIAQEEQTGTDSPEAREKYQKKGMTET
jgi:hypothetical protein